MKLIRTLVAAGLKRSKGAFLGLFLLMALTATALSFTINLYNDLNAREEIALEQAGAGDMYAYDVAENLTDGVIADIEALDEVEQVRSNEAISVPLVLHGKNSNVDRNPTAGNIIEAWGDGLNYRLFSDDGTSFAEQPQAPRENKVYVPLPMKVSPGLDIGDEVEFIVGDTSKTFTVDGFIEDPQMGTPFMEINRFVLSQGCFDELAGLVDGASADQGVPTDIFSANRVPYRMVEINVDMTAEARAAGTTPFDLTSVIASGTAWGTSASGLFSSTTLLGFSMMVVIIGTAIMAVFALLLFIIALVICTHTISTSIEEDYADYGTLKALGVTNKALICVLVAQYAGASMAGLLVGLIAGMVAVPFALPFFAQLTGVLATPNTFPITAVGCLAVLLVLVVAIVAIKARALARVSPIVAFRGGMADAHFKSHGSYTITGKALSLQLALRAILSTKRRYVGLLACSTILCAFIVLVFGISGTLNTPNAALDTFGMWKSDLTVAPEVADVDYDEVQAVVEEVSPIDKTWKEAFVMIGLNGESRSFVGLTDMSILKGVAQGRAPSHDNEIVIGSNLASSMGLSIGDEFRARGTDGVERTFLVSGILSAMFNAGYGCIVTYDALRDLSGEGVDDHMMARQYSLADPAAADNVRDRLAERFGDSINTQPGGMFSDTTDMIALVQTLFLSMSYAMAGVAALLVLLAVSLITERMFSSERHDLGVYRALGFTSRRLRIQFALRFFLVSLLGCVLGTAITAAGGGLLMSQLFGLFGVSQFAIDKNPVMLIMLTVGLALLFLAAAYWSARAIKRIDVRELVVE